MASLYFDKEEFRAVPISHQLWASASGKIVSTRPRNGRGRKPSAPRQLTPNIDKDGYARIDSAGKHLAVHRCVLCAWHRDKTRGEECRHLDDDKTNNALSNLKWGTQHENTDDKIAFGTHRGENNTAAKLTEARVVKLRADYANKPLAALVRENPDLSKFCVWAAVSGYTWTHLPGALPKNRKCSQPGYRSGIRVR